MKYLKIVKIVWVKKEQALRKINLLPLLLNNKKNKTICKKLMGSLSTQLFQDMSSKNKNNHRKKQQIINNNSLKSVEMPERINQQLQSDRLGKYLKFNKLEQLRNEIKFKKLHHQHHYFNQRVLGIQDFQSRLELVHQLILLSRKKRRSKQ